MKERQGKGETERKRYLVYLKSRKKGRLKKGRELKNRQKKIFV